MSKNVDEISKYWKSNLSNFPPIANKLKTKFNERWFRIHTLPQSKRYPENEAEYSEIFRRHNLILADLFGSNHDYFLLTTSYGINQEIPLKDKKLEKLKLQTEFWLSINVADENEESPFFWHIYFDRRFWKQDSINEIFRLIADDEISNVMLFSTQKLILYHPYDGGADIILKNSELRDWYKNKYQHWLSIHPLGF